jgi:hypothetical protein
MLKKLRKSSGTVTLVLIGVAALAGCAEERRDVYASKDDCLADWGNKPEDCSPSSDPKHAGRGFFYGPMYSSGGWFGSSDSTSGRSWNRSTGTYSSARASSRSIGSTSGGSSSRGGFGSSGRSSSSS